MLPSHVAADQLKHSQDQFLDALENRVLALEEELLGLDSADSFMDAQERLRGRLEAMSDTASFLDLEAISTAFTSAEMTLARSHDSIAPNELAEVRDTLQLVPTLAPAAPSTPNLELPVPTRHETIADELFEQAWADSAAVEADSDSDDNDGVEVAVEEPAAPTVDSAPQSTPSNRVTAAANDPAPAAAASDARQQRAPGDLEHLKAATVLVTDDDPAVTSFFASALSKAGATVLEAHDGRQAWEIALSQSPDLILSDIAMPHLDGFGLCRNLKRDVVLSDVPVILLGWKADELQRARELGAGANAYLLKDSPEGETLVRCAETLKARAGIASRLSVEEVTTGRLDGLTPVLILRLVCAASNHARITFRDAAFEYEVVIAGGKFAEVKRFGRDMSEDSGPGVLPGLVGMRAGHFCVERVGAASEENARALDEVLTPCIRHIRSCVRQLQGANLQRITRLGVDVVALEPYLKAAPAVVAKIVNKLSAGIAPSALLRSVSAGLLETVLLDIATRGTIDAAYDSDGSDLLKQPIDAKSSMFDFEVRTPTTAVPGVVAAQPVATPQTRAASTTAKSELAAPPQAELPEPAPKVDSRAPMLPPSLESEPVAAISKAPKLPKATVQVASPGRPAMRKVEKLGDSDPTDLSSWVFDSMKGTPKPPSATQLTERNVNVNAEPTSELDDDLGAEIQTTPQPGALRRIGGQAQTLLTRSGKALQERCKQTQADASKLFSLSGKGSDARDWFDDSIAPPAVEEVSKQTVIAESDDDLDPDLQGEAIPLCNQTRSGTSPKSQRRPFSGIAASLRSAAIPAAVLLATTGGAYLVMNQVTAKVDLQGPQLQQRAPHLAAMTTSAQATATGAKGPDKALLAAPGSAAKRAADPTTVNLQSKTLAMPSGIAVSADKGLLEINTEDTHRIYVSNVFVGRGPVRRIPLKPGSHTVMIRDGATESEFEVTIDKGKRTRLQPMAQAAK